MDTPREKTDIEKLQTRLWSILGRLNNNISPAERQRAEKRLKEVDEALFLCLKFDTMNLCLLIPTVM